MTAIADLTARRAEKEREQMKACVRILADATDRMRDLGMSWREIAGLLRWAAAKNVSDAGAASAA